MPTVDIRIGSEKKQTSKKNHPSTLPSKEQPAAKHEDTASNQTSLWWVLLRLLLFPFALPTILLKSITDYVLKERKPEWLDGMLELIGLLITCAAIVSLIFFTGALGFFATLIANADAGGLSSAALWLIGLDVASLLIFATCVLFVSVLVVKTVYEWRYAVGSSIYGFLYGAEAEQTHPVDAQNPTPRTQQTSSNTLAAHFSSHANEKGKVDKPRHKTQEKEKKRAVSKLHQAIDHFYDLGEESASSSDSEEIRGTRVRRH